jgi:hypothetical protein
MNSTAITDHRKAPPPTFISIPANCWSWATDTLGKARGTMS